MLINYPMCLRENVTNPKKNHKMLVYIKFLLLIIKNTIFVTQYTTKNNCTAFKSGSLSSNK